MSNPEAVSPRPRVALVCQSLTGTGGTERVVASISGMLSERFDLYEFSFDPPGSTRHFESPACFMPLGASLRLPLFLRPISYALDALRLRRAKRRLGIAVTISNLWRADLLSVLSMGPDRKVSICHSNIVGNPRNSLIYRFRSLSSLVYRRFERVVSVSGPLGEEIRALFGLPESKSCVIHNCVLPRLAASSQKTVRRSRVVWCGRFVAEKNVETLIEIFADAFRSDAALQLVLIGDGPLRAKAEHLVARLGLKAGQSFEDAVSDVIMTGFVRDPMAYMARCDFQVLPSTAEGLGMVLLEGFSVAIPALASDCSGGGVHDAMGGAASYRPGRDQPEETSCGFLLPVPDLSLPETLRVWRCHLLRLATDAALRQRLSAGAVSRAGLFSAEVISPRWFRLMDEMLSPSVSDA